MIHGKEDNMAKITVRWEEYDPVSGRYIIQDRVLSDAETGWEIKQNNLIAAYAHNPASKKYKTILVPIDHLLSIEEDMHATS